MRILMVIDAQERYVQDKSMVNTLKKIAGLIESDAFDMVIATQLFRSKLSPFNRLKLTEDVFEEPMAKEIKTKFKIVKNTFSCITEEFIDDLEKIIGTRVNEIYLCGFETDGAILSTAYALFDYNIKPVVMTDYVDSRDKDLHNASLHILKKNLGELCLYLGRAVKCPVCAGLMEYNEKTDTYICLDCGFVENDEFYTKNDYI